MLLILSLLLLFPTYYICVVASKNLLGDDDVGVVADNEAVVDMQQSEAD